PPRPAGATPQGQGRRPGRDQRGPGRAAQPPNGDPEVQGRCRGGIAGAADGARAGGPGAAKRLAASCKLLRMTIVAAPDEVRDQVRNLTRMQLIRVVAAWRPDVSNAADPITAYRV